MNDDPTEVNGEYRELFVEVTGGTTLYERQLEKPLRIPTELTSREDEDLIRTVSEVGTADGLDEAIDAHPDMSFDSLW